MISGLASRIILVDVEQARTEGEAMDLSHGLPFVRPAEVRSGTYDDCADADIILITAGSASRPGETRLNLVDRNIAIYRQIIPAVTRNNDKGILLVVSNPVDILTHAAWELSGWPAARVLGSGTVLDSARFRTLLGAHCNIDPRNVHAYVLGEHGDSEVPIWSRAQVGGLNLLEHCPTCGPGGCTAEVRQTIARQTTRAAYEIIQRKGATFYAVGLAARAIVESILRDQNSVLTVSTLAPGDDRFPPAFFSVPAVVNRNGVSRLLPIGMNEEERAALANSASVLHDLARDVGLTEPPRVAWEPGLAVRAA
jgi:L-lactate dehydrogenase